MADSIYTFDPTPGNNTSLDSIPYGPNQLYHNQIDNWFRSLASKLAQFVDDLGAVNTVAGTGDAVTVTLASGITAYATGQFFKFVASAANTGAATLNVNSIGAKAIRKISGGTDVALVAGDLAAGVTYEVVYRATANSAAGAWVLVGSSVASATTSQAGIVELATVAEGIAGTSATVVPPVTVTAAMISQQAALLALEIADLKGDRLGMVGGIADPFDDEGDVDTTTSTNESYNSTTDLYSPTTGAGTLIANGTGTAIGGDGTSSNPGNAFDDNDTTYASGADNLGAYVGKSWASAVSISRFVCKSPTGRNFTGGVTNTINWTFDGSSNGTDWTTIDSGTVEDTQSTQITIDRTVPSGTPYSYHRVRVSRASPVASWRIAEVDFYEAAFNNMTLVSNAFTADIAPSVARVAVQVIEKSATTINTDLTMEASRDGGTTWATASLALTATTGTVKLYQDNAVDVSGQPSGTSMKWRVKTLNNKNIDVSGVVLQWK